VQAVVEPMLRPVFDEVSGQAIGVFIGGTQRSRDKL